MTTLEMATLCEQQATSVDGAHAVRFLRYAAAMRKCRPNAPCRMDACPRCNLKHTRKNARLVESLIRDVASESLRVMVFDIPVTVALQDLEQTTDRVLAALTRLTKSNTPWARIFSRWAGQVRVKLEPAPTAGADNGDTAVFHFSIRFVVEVRKTFHLAELERRWRLLLHSLVLAPQDPGKRALVRVIEPKGDARNEARRTCRSTSSWLAPIKRLPAPSAIAYHKVLPELLRLRAHVAAA